MTIKSRLHQIMIAVSQLVNTLIWVENTYADEMLSAKAWRLKDKGWGWLMLSIDFVWFWESNHCYKSYLEEKQRLYLPKDYKEYCSKY